MLAAGANIVPGVAGWSPDACSTQLQRKGEQIMLHRIDRTSFAAHLIVTLALVASSLPAQTAPALVGTWALNASRTEEPKERVIEEPEAVGTRTMRTNPGRTVTVGSAGAGTLGARASGRASFRLVFGGMVSASKTLRITQADSIVTIDDEDGPVFVNLRADNKDLVETLANQTVLKTSVQWKKDELVIERTHDTDGSARMILRIDAKNPKQLIVDFHYEHKRQRRTIDQRRIYDAGL